jgi:hypothetical protein
MRIFPVVASLLPLLSVSMALTGCVTAQSVPQTPAKKLENAVKNRNRVLVEKLIAEGAVPGEGSKGVLADGFGYAEYYGDRDILKMLIKRCQEVYVLGQNCASAPCYVARRGDIASLTAFMARGLDVNAEMSGATLLTCAASEGNMANVKFLIEKGADVEKSISGFEASNVKLAAQNSAPANAAISKQNAAIALLERLRPGGKVAKAADSAGGVTKAELAQMMKEAAAETRQAAAPAPVAAAVVYKSDVDAPAYKVSENPDAYALVVGVEKYNTLPDARFADRDAKAMNAHLLAMGYPQRNIVLLTGSQATRTGLAKNLEAWLPNNVTERSTVLFYFSGHGAPDAKTSLAYLVPMDGDPQYLEETAYPIKRLYAKLAALKAKRVLVALDSCFSGAGGRSVLAQGTRPLVGKLQTPPTGRVVSLSASASDEVTGTAEDQGHGLFTYQLLKALTETAGRGTVAELYGALRPRVQDDARRQNRGQTPQLSGAAVDAGLR